jgi:hypothetical protein
MRPQVWFMSNPRMRSPRRVIAGLITAATAGDGIIIDVDGIAVGIDFVGSNEQYDWQ